MGASPMVWHVEAQLILHYIMGFTYLICSVHYVSKGQLIKVIAHSFILNQATRPLFMFSHIASIRHRKMVSFPTSAI